MRTPNVMETVTLRMIWEAASKKKNPKYRPGWWSNRGVSLKELSRESECWEKGKGEPLSDWIDDEVWNGGTCWDWKLSRCWNAIFRGPYGSGLDGMWFICLFINPFFNKYLLISLCVLGRVPGAEDKTMSKTQTLFWRNSSLVGSTANHNTVCMITGPEGSEKRDTHPNWVGGESAPGRGHLGWLWRLN